MSPLDRDSNLGVTGGGGGGGGGEAVAGERATMYHALIYVVLHIFIFLVHFRYSAEA